MIFNLNSGRSRFFEENLALGFLSQNEPKWTENEVFQVL